MSADNGQLDLDDFLGDAGEPEGSADALHAFVGEDDEQLDLSKPYAAVAAAMWRAGWHGVLPLPKGRKHAPPAGYTGRGAPYLSFADVFSLIEVEGAAGANICVRLPETVVGIDVDHYGSKRGGDTLAGLESRWGALPATWRSTSRGADNPGGIRFYRVPAGEHFLGGFEAIEIIQEGHRYAVVWPSTNPDAGGARYQWYDPSGEPVDSFPKPDELPDLPAAWLEGIRSSSPHVTATALVPKEVEAWLAELRRGPMCGRTRVALRQDVETITAPRGTISRHDLTMKITRRIIAYGGEGHALGDEQQHDPAARYPSTSPIWRIDAVRDLGRAFIQAVTRPSGGMVRDIDGARAEFESLVYGAVRVAATKNRLPETHDPECFEFDDEVPPWVGPVVSAPRRLADTFNPRNEPGAVLTPDEAEAEGAAMMTPPAAAPEAEAHARETRQTGGVAASGVEIKDTASPDPAPEPEPLDMYTSTAKPHEPKVERPIDAAFTDARLAERVAIEVMAGRFCWTGALGWLAWDGRVWAECEQAIAVEAVREHFLDWFSTEVKAGADSARRKALGGLLSAGRIASIANLTRGLIIRDAAEFDRDPNLLNCKNGVVDLRTGVLMPHDPSRSMRKITDVSYEPNKTHPDFLAALACLPAEVCEWYQVRLGQAITGYMTSDDKLVVAQGGGDNGKTTLHGTLGAALGSYYEVISDRVLMANPDAHPTELMDLMGARLAVAEETPEARHLNIQRLKTVIGTPFIKARRIRENPVTFKATHSFFQLSNYRPLVTETDHGTWRRLLLVVFPYKFVAPGAELKAGEKHGDPTLRERLAASVRRDGPAARAGLAWLVEGAKRWYAAEQVMPAEPEQVVKDSQKWRAESDQVIAYLNERIEFDPEAGVLASDLLADIGQWLVGNGAKAWGDKIVAARFGDHDEFKQRSVIKKRARTASVELSRTPNITTEWLGEQATLGYRKEVSAVAIMWLGIKFRNSDNVGPEQE